MDKVLYKLLYLYTCSTQKFYNDLPATDSMRCRAISRKLSFSALKFWWIEVGLTVSDEFISAASVKKVKLTVISFFNSI